ncbi:hypothetical protein [Rhodovarius lipocyclicus]|uniref:hypothetical protein n=1 Tax=Rhodovarius lipocyclicus TaxID=268410 RepID=UPI001357500B|nr:hypothetical protein [Rhodovarius lipocyclicus]
MPFLALLPLALQLLPTLGRWLGGSDGEAVASTVGQAVQAVTGTSDPAAAEAALAASPELRVQLTTRLAEIDAAREAARDQALLETLRAGLADTANARATGLGLVQAGSMIAWAPVVVSVIVLGAFAAVVWLAMSAAMPQGSETTLTMLLGSLSTMAGAVVSYWVGSSSGSADKTRLLAQASTPPLALPAAGRRA